MNNDSILLRPWGRHGVSHGLVRIAGKHFAVQCDTVSGSSKLKITETSFQPSVEFIKLQGALNIFSIPRQLSAP